MSLPVRLGLFYSAIFVGTGAASPYMPVWFAHHGLSGAQIGLILSLPMLARAFTAPLLAIWADSFKLRRTALSFMSLGVMAAYALMALPMGFAGWTVVWFAASSAFSTISPLTDVIVLNRARRDGFNYGWPRGIGSVAFMIANVVMGAILTWGSPDLVLVWITASVGLTALAARFLLPPDPVHEEGHVAKAADRFAGVSGLLRDPAFMTAAIAAGLIQSAHAFYYGFSTLVWKQQGVPESMTGILWAVGVAAEVGFMWFMEPWRRRVGPRNLLVLGGAAAMLRWTALAFVPPLWVLFPLQLLHVLSYAATFLASLQLIERLSTPANASAAQALNSALSSGMLMGLATMASGPLFDRFGAQGYFLMTLMCGLGLVGAVRLYGVRKLDPA
ncbi:MAG: MFS transporter [Alphaproteobacteria bacterium]|nr:MFS transporter [Alphaproteobacteria bacterium]MBU1512974.1 MFS transporter [Alphaproteobacteria bacterium]MBU2094852.1 MFS transporter [Alphaproteobacteria bacterium]MBU2152758.1 MFS transporter [Alphaproteobacteria bacterium]MBU2306333.1 MFS transporter [Alphaproteobacteria bacterium]